MNRNKQKFGMQEGFVTIDDNMNKTQTQKKGNESENLTKSENVEMDSIDDEDEEDFEDTMQIEDMANANFILMGDDTNSFDDDEDDNVDVTNPNAKSLNFNLAAGWDDSAIMRCFDLAIQTHDSKNVNEHCFHPDQYSSQWKTHKTVTSTTSFDNGASADEERPKKLLNLDPPPRWRPGDLPLPQWAVDPWYAIQKGTYSKSLHTATLSSGTSSGNEIDKEALNNAKKRIAKAMDS